ncbi:MAG: ATP-binding cassette domain-containing protein [Chloroflexota bacterium]
MTLHPPANAEPFAPKRVVLPILEARTLTKQYRMPGETVEAVRGVTLSVMPGEFVALMGPSGSGKSTLLQLLGGLDQPTSGEVLLEGEPIGRLSDLDATCACAASGPASSSSRSTSCR